MGLAFASLAAAAIHVAAGVVEAPEGPTTLLFFVAVALAQAAWGGVALFRGSRAWLAIGALGNLAVAAVWLWSRTSGLPVGDYAGVRLPVGFPDATTTALEVAIAIGAGFLALRSRRVDRAAARTPGFAVVAGLLIAGLATVAVLVQLGVIGGLASAS